MDHRVSTVIVSYRTGPVLFDCLAALLAETGIAEVVLVDNGNPGETVGRLGALAAQSCGRMQIVGDGVNRGFSAGVNLGAAVSTAERLLILNPDAVLAPGSLAALEAALQTGLTAGAEPVVVGGKIVGEDGLEQAGCRRRRLTAGSALGTFLGLSVLGRLVPALASINRTREPEPPGPVPMGAVSGALMYLSREGFHQLDGFDEGYFLHVEDLDICRRAEEAGGAVIYTPLASARHLGATSEAPSRVVERHKAAGFRRYFRKFARTPGDKLVAACLVPAIALALDLRVRLRGG
jgi:N-acetylglucosaminyl-diphospho-decaprenol L-rhamnosyltransferase